MQLKNRGAQNFQISENYKVTIGGGKCYYIANIVVRITIIVMEIISSFITFGNKNYSYITIQKKIGTLQFIHTFLP